MSIHNSKQISDVKILLKTGVDGVGIVDIEKTGTQGLVDTYTITLSNGTKYTFTVTNGEDGQDGQDGNGIESIEKTGTQGLVDTYTITFDDGSTETFTVTNGKDGADGGMSAKFLITSDAGSTVSVTTPSGTVISATQVSGSTTQWECESAEYGTHTINSVLSGATASTTVNVDTCQIYSATVIHFNATITVTYNPNDAVCTCVGGSESYTATGSPYTFTVHSANTFTITVTKGTITKTETVAITTDGQSASKSISLVPTGSTVTPVNDIQTWLHCADIWNKSYTTIAQVLADSTTLSALIADANAVDYMVRSTTWALSVCANQTAMSYIGLDNYCADTLLADSTWSNAICDSTYFESVLNVKVPTMTSDTTPSGVASSSSNYPSRQAYHAYDGSSVTAWAGADGQTNNWNQYKFPSSIICKVIEVYFEVAGSARSYSFQASKDGNSWTTLKSGTTVANSLQKFIVENTIDYSYFRINVSGNMSESGTNYITVRNLNYYGRASS